MRLKQYINMAVVAALAVGMTSCNDWLTDDTPGTNNRDEYFTSISTLENVTNACYVPLAWEYGDTYYSEWFFGDIASDDALKGGQGISDGGDAYDIDNFKVNTNNESVLEYYRAQWQGIARCNLALDEIAKKKGDLTKAADLLEADRLEGEAHFMRAFYYFRLLRLYGGMRRRLRDLGLLPGVQMQCAFVAPAGSPMAFWVKHAMIALRKDDCRRILVRRCG